ncbi:probable myosin-binding protein 5 [Sorghum bicolor]|uniref:GTD-binding domain-containing protein n=1 Tax=Sorghum bicolor TaxID=4558 RepID=C5WX46_SORBI|nr:probable myosin-binding protein 5 [Sorghum bicolor]EER93280.1 hypothetical protein SORBI_3001G054600 [Sorghum bicolor]|eukprot:XP_002466282.1 probable myosin-binding protein 5 [Sorghum bicolor]
MASRTSIGDPWRYQQFSALLTSVVQEWVLMLLLLLEGLLSYLVTTFAQLCKLQPPCPICTRLDHVLGKAHPGFYRELMCSSHKAEASSWAFCHIHQKLVDVHRMCEACLLSFAADKKSNLETYRSLVGKLGVGVDNVGCKNNFTLRNGATEAPVMEDILCSCCSRPLQVRSHPFVVLQSKSSGIGIERICRVVSRDQQSIDEINYVSYNELKTSDTESEPSQPGGNVGSFLKDDKDKLKEGFVLDHLLAKIADDRPQYDNSEEKLPEEPGLIPVQNDGCDNQPSESSGGLHNIQDDGNTNLQSTDISNKDRHQIREDSNTRGDKSEDEVWHNALSSSDELSIATKSVETDTLLDENKVEFTQRKTRNNSLKVHEDLKSLLSQLSTASASRATDSDSPIVQNNHEQAILNNITRALSLDRNYSGISESMVNEAEGECTIDQLKQQIELDRKSISRLWKELEEERNASAVAANQTMAMITRLQEEKAAMQMEALQYQRMMEEQSEYDREDLQKMTGVVQNLQAEIEGYKIKLKDQLLVNEICDHMSLSEQAGSSISRIKSLACFEDEKTYISKRLRKLRQKLHEFSNNSKHVPVQKLSDDKEDPVDDRNSDDGYEDANEDGKTDDSVFEKHLGRNGYSSRDLKRSDPKGQYHAMVSENDLVSFEDEISQVSERLMALEADRSFLEHSVNSLKNGKEGEALIRNIAGSLRELRKMGIGWKE